MRPVFYRVSSSRSFLFPFFSFSKATLGGHKRDSAELCHMLVNKPDLKMDIQIFGVSISQSVELKYAYFGTHIAQN